MAVIVVVVLLSSSAGWSWTHRRGSGAGRQGKFGIGNGVTGQVMDGAKLVEERRRKGATNKSNNPSIFLLFSFLACNVFQIQPLLSCVITPNQTKGSLTPPSYSIMMSPIQIAPIYFISIPTSNHTLPTLQFNHTNQYFQPGVNHLALISSQLSVHCVVEPVSF